MRLYSVAGVQHAMKNRRSAVERALRLSFAEMQAALERDGGPAACIPPDPFLVSAAVRMYGRKGLFRQAESLLDAYLGACEVTPLLLPVLTHTPNNVPKEEEHLKEHVRRSWTTLKAIGNASASRLGTRPRPCKSSKTDATCNF